MLLATALALLIARMCSTDVYCSNKPAAVAPKETITHHFFVSGIGQKKKLSMQPNLWRRRKCWAKTETQQTPVNGLLGFITLGIYTPLEARVYCSIIIAELPIGIWATLSALLINILLGSFQLFLHSDQPSEGEIIPFSGTASRGAALSTPEAVVASRTDWQTALMCNWRDDQRQHHHAEHHFQLLVHQLNLFVHFARAQQHHADASACQ